MERAVNTSSARRDADGGKGRTRPGSGVAAVLPRRLPCSAPQLLRDAAQQIMDTGQHTNVSPVPLACTACTVGRRRM